MVHVCLICGCVIFGCLGLLFDSSMSDSLSALLEFQKHGCQILENKRNGCMISFTLLSDTWICGL